MTANDHLAVAAAYTSALRAADVEAAAALCEPDAVMWHNFDALEVQLATLPVSRIHEMMPDLVWKDVALLPTPSGFIWQSLLTGTTPHGSVRAPICMVFTLSAQGRVADRRVRRCRHCRGATRARYQPSCVQLVESGVHGQRCHHQPAHNR